MKRVYVAGSYSGKNIIECLDNIRIGLERCSKILKNKKIVPFCPWNDFLFQFFNKNLDIEDYYRYSMAWLEVSDELWVLPKYKNSKGTLAEIKRAKELNIPVIYLK